MHVKAAGQAAFLNTNGRSGSDNMKTMVEVFYLCIIGNQVCYQQKQVDLSRKGVDPNVLIESFMQQKLQSSAEEVRQEFVVHSTSWRYAPPGRVILTYIAYSDELSFDRGEVKNLSLKALRKINISNGKPRSRNGLERQVVAHAMRHISFLIKTDHQGEFKLAFTPRSRKIFKSLWSDLAGRVAF
jgi:hypothetical protein